MRKSASAYVVGPRQRVDEPASLQRQSLDEAHGAHPRHALQFTQHPGVGARKVIRVRITHARKLEIGCKNALDVESAVDLHHAYEAGEQQPGHHQQTDADRRLHADEQGWRRSATSCRPLAHGQRLGRIDATGLPCRCKRAQHATGERYAERRGKHPAVDAHLVEPRQVGRRRREQKTQRPVGDPDTTEPSRQGEQQALAQRAQDSVARGRPQCPPQGKVASMLQPTGAEQVRHVHACHHQYCHDGREEEPEGAARIPGHLVRQRATYALG